MKKIEKWQILDSELVFNNKWSKVRRDRVKLTNETIIDDYFINIRPDIALVFPLTINGDVVFVRQYRHGVREILIELPAGSFDPQTENSLEAAHRELEEETGYISDCLVKIGTLYDNPVKDTNKIHVFLAKNAVPLGKQNLDITEDIEIVLIPLQDVEQKIFAREIAVSGSIAAIFLALNFLSLKIK
jgi:8-oxo-dGTP pyrophosphatase MutT (NUDIX family)